ncbi:MAG: lipase family protein [Ginsengibacter sp.]
MKKSITITCLLLFVIIWSSCKKNDWHHDPGSGSNYFVSATPLGTFSKSDLQGLAVKAGFAVFAPLAHYDVDFFKLIYKTSFKGNMIQVSGLLAIPKNVLSIPSLVSAQHGTIFRFSDAPSNFPNSFSGFELFASAGYVTVIPDYIGYGVSQNIPHPYYDKQYSALSVVNMIEAAKYYLQKQKAAITNRLFLVGYSEGGYTTMAAQKEIETNPSHLLTVTGAAEGAGGYDLTTFLSAIADTATYSAPSFLALIIKSYNNTYNWNRPFSDFFQQPYASQIPDLLDGSKTRSDIDAALPNSTAALFNPIFYASLKNPTKETALKTKVGENSFLTWVPKSPTRLYHGTADEAVPFKTSVVTYGRFIAAGATNVEFFPIPGGTHTTSVTPMMANALPWLQSLDK